MTTTTATVSTLPDCNFCKDGTKALYDFKTQMGPWGFGCTEHYEAYKFYPTLGTGKGQRLVLRME